MGGAEKDAGGPRSPVHLATWYFFLGFWRSGRQQILQSSYNPKHWLRVPRRPLGQKQPPSSKVPVSKETPLGPSQMTHSETCPRATATNSRACGAQ